MGMIAPKTEQPSSDAEATAAIERLVERYDSEVFDLERPRARLRIDGFGAGPRDIVIEDGQARLEMAHGHPDAELVADRQTWEAIASDLRGGLSAFRSGRLRVRRDLHLGVGFLAATAAPGE